MTSCDCSTMSGQLQSIGYLYCWLRILCVCLCRYSGRTQKQLSEYVRENCVKRPAFHRFATYSFQCRIRMYSVVILLAEYS